MYEYEYIKGCPSVDDTERKIVLEHSIRARRKALRKQENDMLINIGILLAALTCYIVGSCL